MLVEARDRLGLSPEATLAIGDGANDIPMIEEAGLGIAYRAKPALAAVADARLDHHGLDALLWAQGISRARMGRGLARLDREAGLGREAGAGGRSCGPAFVWSGLQTHHRPSWDIIGIPSCQFARQFAEQCLGGFALTERTELDAPLAADRDGAGLACRRRRFCWPRPSEPPAFSMSTLARGGAAAAGFFSAIIAWASATPFCRCSSGIISSMSARVAWAGASPCAAARLT